MLLQHNLCRHIFYFTEKHLAAIAELDIDEKIKEDFCREKPIGKLPLYRNIRGKELPDNIMTIVQFKKSLK